MDFNMEISAHVLLSLGIVLLIGLAVEIFRTFVLLPRVTLLLVVGLLLGPHAINFIPSDIIALYRLVAYVFVALTGFLIGMRFHRQALEEYGAMIFKISGWNVAITFVVTLTGFIMMGYSWPVSLILAAISPVGAPNSTVDVIGELKARGMFPNTVLGIVAFCNLWCFILFSIVLSIVSVTSLNVFEFSILYETFWNIFGAVLIGGLFSLPGYFLHKHITLPVYRYGLNICLVFICAGLSIALNASFLIACLTMGIACAQYEHNGDEEEIISFEYVKWPFMVVFFVLSGTILNVADLYDAGLLGGFYILLRCLGKYFGAYFAAWWLKLKEIHTKWLGVAIQSQAGFAIGMALVASQHFPDIGDLILHVIIGSTLLFGIVGPVLVRYAILKVRRSLNPT